MLTSLVTLSRTFTKIAKQSIENKVFALLMDSEKCSPGI